MDSRLIEDELQRLHEAGATVTEAMAFLYRHYRIPLAEAKRLVSSHPRWQKATQASAPLQESVVRALSQIERGADETVADGNQKND